MTSCSRTNKANRKNTARPLGRLGAFLLVTLRRRYHASRRDLGAGKRALPDHNGEILPLHARNERDPVDPEHLFSQEEVDAFKSESTENDETETVNTSLIRIAPRRGEWDGNGGRRRGAHRHHTRHSQGQAAHRARPFARHSRRFE